MESKRQIVPPGTEPLYDNYHFAPAIRVGDHIWVSGQVGIDQSFKPGDGMEQQARLVFEGLKTTLAAAGATLADIVEIISFHTDLRGEMAEFTKVKDEYLPKDFPCWSAVGVTQLADAAFKVEVRVAAVAGSGAS